MPTDSSPVSRALKVTVWGMGVVLLGGLLFLGSVVIQRASKPSTTQQGCTLGAQTQLPPHSHSIIHPLNSDQTLLELHQGAIKHLITIDHCTGAIKSHIQLPSSTTPNN